MKYLEKYNPKLTRTKLQKLDKTNTNPNTKINNNNKNDNNKNILGNECCIVVDRLLDAQ